MTRLEIIVGSLEARRGTVKQVGGNGEVTFARKAFRHIPNVGVDPEGFVIDQQARVGVASSGRAT